MHPLKKILRMIMEMLKMITQQRMMLRTILKMRLM